MSPIDLTYVGILGYGILLAYLACGRIWSTWEQKRWLQSVENAEIPRWRIELPRHPHSISGWDQTRVSIPCKAVDSEKGDYLCSDCRDELKRHGLEYTEWVKEWNDVAGEGKTRRTWVQVAFWPLWLILHPARLLLSRPSGSNRPLSRPRTPLDRDLPPSIRVEDH